MSSPGFWVVFNESNFVDKQPVMLMDDGVETSLGRDNHNNQNLLYVRNMRVSRIQVKCTPQNDGIFCKVVGVNPIGYGKHSISEVYKQKDSFKWFEGSKIFLSANYSHRDSLSIERHSGEETRNHYSGLIKSLVVHPPGYSTAGIAREDQNSSKDITSHDGASVRCVSNSRLKLFDDVVPIPILNLNADDVHNDFPLSTADKFPDFNYQIEARTDRDIYQLELPENVIVSHSELATVWNQSPDMDLADSAKLKSQFEGILSRIQSEEARDLAVEKLRNYCETNFLSKRGENRPQDTQLSRLSSMQWILPSPHGQPQPAGILSPRSRGDQSPTSARLWNKRMRYSFSWAPMENVALGVNTDENITSSTSPETDPNDSKIRTADGCPFMLQRQSSVSSIMSSDKHLSPRAMKQRLSDADLLEDTSSGDQKSCGSVASSQVISEDKPVPQGTPRVGPDFQVDIPQCVKTAPTSIVEVSSHSLGPWSLMKAKVAEPMREDDVIKKSSLSAWSSDDKLAFTRDMYEYLKDFISIARGRHFTQKRAVSELIAYYYEIFKETDDYRKWKTFVNNCSEDEMKSLASKLQQHTNEEPTNSDEPKTSLQAIQELLQVGLLNHGDEKLTLIYRAQLFRASLNSDGTISFKDKAFTSPSDFSTFVKESLNPEFVKLHGVDNGWKSVHFNGKSLMEIGHQYFQSDVIERIISSNTQDAPSKPEIVAVDSEVPDMAAALLGHPSTGSGGFSIEHLDGLQVLPPTATPWSQSKSTEILQRSRVARLARSTQILGRYRHYFDLESVDSDGSQAEDIASPQISQRITILDLMKANRLIPGKNSLLLNHNGRLLRGSLKKSGKVVDVETEEEFDTPSAWSCKYLDVHNELASDHHRQWKSIFYVPPKDRELKNLPAVTDISYQTLEQYRHECVSEQQATDSTCLNKTQTSEPPSPTHSKKRKKSQFKTRRKQVKGNDEPFCICQSTEKSCNGDSTLYFQCLKASGACNGWFHPRCFGFDAKILQSGNSKSMVCPLCSADGVSLTLQSTGRFVKENIAIYPAGTEIMSRIDYPAGNPIGWFAGKIVEVDMVHHKKTPYRISYAFQPKIMEWIDLAPNDPTRVLAWDWLRYPVYYAQNQTWRKGFRINCSS